VHGHARHGMPVLAVEQWGAQYLGWSGQGTLGLGQRWSDRQLGTP